MIESGRRGVKWMAAGAACLLLLLAVVPAIVGVALSGDALPRLSPSPVVGEPLPWDESWDSANIVAVKCPSGASGKVRVAAVRAQRHRDQVFLMVEWDDRSNDLSFEGAYYPEAVSSAEPMVQETTLLRDGLTLWLGDGGKFAAASSILASSSSTGRIVWRSHWQSDVDRGFLASIREKDGTPLVDSFPDAGGGAYSARYVGNANAILDVRSPCRWLRGRTPDVFSPDDEQEVDGSGQWRSGRWRVVFRLPYGELERVGKQLTMALAITDGGASERTEAPAVSQCFTLDLRGTKAAGGGSSDVR